MRSLLFLLFTMATLIDGFNDQSGGMDASRTPEVIAERNFALGVNVVARNGMPATRPMYRRIDMELPAAAIRTTYFQGSKAYYNPGSGARLLLAAFAGRIYSFNPIAATWVDLSAAEGLVNDATATHYFCQAESYMVIQSGRDGALIFDGVKLRRATEDEVPTGTMMAYGQGRLWVVSPDFRAILGCDLVYGGSIASIPIFLSTPLAGGTTRFTTTKPHNFTSGDTVTIQRHYASPSVIGTWTITVLNGTQFTIPAAITTGSGGGVALRANDGEEADVLRATEYRYANEKGIFRLPAWMGKIRAVTFFPVQDTGTGQGDLFVAGENGACSFLVSQPRDTWLNIPIQRVALTEIGFSGHLSLAQVNGDIFFGSRDGLRSYRNARAEFGTYGNTPLSAEIAHLLPTSNLPVLSRSSMALHDNRLLFTASPRVLASSDVTLPPRYIFQSLAALDFQQSSRMTKGGLAAYDGIWTGLDVLQLVPANFGHEERLYAWCWQPQDGGSNPRAHELWEITTQETGYDEWRDCDTGAKVQQPIKAVAELRAFAFGDWRAPKRLTRMDLWLDNARGAAAGIWTYWRPDLHGGGWFFWENSEVTPAQCAVPGTSVEGCESQPQIRPPFHVAPLSFGTPPQYEDAMTQQLADRGYTFQIRIDWEGRLRLKKLIAYAEALVDAKQGDSTATTLTDTSGVVQFPQLRPPVASRFSHNITPKPVCEILPCIDSYQNATTPQATILIEFIADSGGPPAVQVFAGRRTLTYNPATHYYELQFPNGFTTAKVLMGLGYPNAYMSLTPDIHDMASTWFYFPGGITLPACIPQPFEISLDANWFLVLP